jgi:hypothetical protein
MLVKKIILITILCIGLAVSAQQKKVPSKGGKDGFEISIHTTNLKDKKMYTNFFKYKNTPGHPKVSEQKAMADSLIAFINQNIKW